MSSKESCIGEVPSAILPPSSRDKNVVVVAVVVLKLIIERHHLYFENRLQQMSNEGISWKESERNHEEVWRNNHKMSWISRRQEIKQRASMATIDEQNEIAIKAMQFKNMVKDFFPHGVKGFANTRM